MTDETPSSEPIPEALRSLSEFPLLAALLGRRSRRFGLGMEIPDGPFAYRSQHAPVPLGELERTLLIAIGGGITGWNLGIPHAAHADAASNACDYPVRLVGRTIPSGAAVHGSELLITDDSGSYITRFRDLDPDTLGAPSIATLADALRPHIVRLTSHRVELPAAYPHIGSHNHWAANRPGSTLFVPIADQVETLLNLIWIYAWEGAPITQGDSGRFYGDPAPLLAAGRLREDRKIDLGVVEAVSLKHTTAEISIAAYNIHLGLQAMGLGGWMYSGIDGASLLGASADEGVPGFGFRYESPEVGRPKEVRGLDGAFEPLIPPYVTDMGEAARRFLERKFGPKGIFGPNGRSASRAPVQIEQDAAMAAYFIGAVEDIHAHHGKFPTTIPAVGVGLYTQAQHIDLDFYEKYYKSDVYLGTHEQHDAVWHASERS